MDSRFIIANGLLAISFLMNVLYISGMEKETQEIVAPLLPRDMAILIIHSNESLEDTIKTTLALRSTCRYFNANISSVEIGKSCRHYDVTEKNKVMKKLLDNMSNKTYWNKRHAALILVHAGADNDADKSYPLLWRAIHQKDKEMVDALYENNANPNQKNFYTEQPHWFDITDFNIVNTFINHDGDLHYNKKGMYPNILWHALVHGHPLELIELYLDYGVNVKNINVKGYCIWHHYVECSLGRSGIKDYVKIGELLFQDVPEMINKKIDKKKIRYRHEKAQTPFSLAYSRLHNSLMPDKKKKVLKGVIHLLEKHGAVDMIDTSDSSDSSES